MLMNNQSEITDHPIASKQSNPKRVRFATAVIALALGLYWAVLFYGTHTRLPPGLLPGNSDKYVHFTSYAILGVLLLSLRATWGTFSWMTVYRRWFLLAGYGAFDELTQMLVDRDADIKDWLADVGGAACGLGLVTFVVWRLYRFTGRRDVEPAADAARS